MARGERGTAPVSGKNNNKKTTFTLKDKLLAKKTPPRSLSATAGPPTRGIVILAAIRSVRQPEKARQPTQAWPNGTPDSGRTRKYLRTEAGKPVRGIRSILTAQSQNGATAQDRRRLRAPI